MIRPLQAEDLPWVLAWEQVSHPLPWSESSLRRSLQDHAGFVLEVEGRPAAFAFVQRILDEAHLLDLVSDPGRRGQGLGRRLLSGLIDEVLVAGVSIWFLEVRISNTAAIALYRALGFNEMGLRRNYYDGPDGREDALLMALSTGMA